MSTPNTGDSRPVVNCVIHKLLRSTKKELEDITFRSVVPTLSQDEVGTLVQDALEVVRLARSWWNTHAPINRVPPEVLILIASFTSGCKGKTVPRKLIHVCRTWRAMFTSYSPFWTHLNCMNAEKTRVYVERSKSSPLYLRLNREDGICSNDPFFQLSPHAIGRLKSLSIITDARGLRDITDHLSCPAPLLEKLSIECDPTDGYDYSETLSPTLFNGDLSSLRKLSLGYIPKIQLPWRNMVNITSFTLIDTIVPMRELLDFFEGAPHLLEVLVREATPDPGDEHGRVVSLGCLKELYVEEQDSTSLLLEHLLIPVGAKVTTHLSTLDIWSHHSTKLISNLRNFSDFTTISLYLDTFRGRIKFTGPNGEVRLDFPGSLTSDAGVARSLAQIDISQTERLEIYNSAPRSEELWQVLLSMGNLRVLGLVCQDLRAFLLALCPGTNSAGPIACPKLENLSLRLHSDEELDLWTLVKVAARRASRGVPFSSVKITNRGQPISGGGERELRKHVSHVETGDFTTPVVIGSGSDHGGDSSDSDDYGDSSDHDVSDNNDSDDDDED